VVLLVLLPVVGGVVAMLGPPDPSALGMLFQSGERESGETSASGEGPAESGNTPGGSPGGGDGIGCGAGPREVVVGSGEAGLPRILQVLAPLS
jgi:hypothetical protein